MPYEYGTGSIAETVRMALDGTREIPPQPDSRVAWLTYALFEMRTDLRISTWFEDYVAQADSLNHLVPTEDEVAWTFLHLRDRGWLQDKGNAYALTAEGLSVIEEITGGEYYALEAVEKLEEWMAAHPL